MICVIHAHPYPSRSRADRALADALREFFARELAQVESDERKGGNRLPATRPGGTH